jgi:3',5'-cyclic AMP phosphodiesterase CpdA
MVVKNKLNPIILIIGLSLILGGCTVDLLGLFGSNDLAVRLKEKEHIFLDDSSRQWRTATFGTDGYSFVVLADSHMHKGDDFGLKAKLKNVVDNNSEIKFVVIAGDVTQKGLKVDVQKFIEIADNLGGIPCYPVIGNHDVYSGNWPEWKSLIGATYYSVDGGGTSLIVLDSATGFFGKKQLDWLEKSLKEVPNGNRVFVFTHANLFTSHFVDIQQFTDIKERARVVSLLSGKCDAMFTGHLHSKVINEAGGVPYISVESFYEQGTYCLVKVEPDGIKYTFKKF